MAVFHALYTRWLSDSYGKVLKDVCWNDAYLTLGLEDQYIGIGYNNKTHSPILLMHVGMLDMHKLLPWPCHVLFDIYVGRTASQSFYMSQIGDYPFCQTFFVHF